MNLYPRGRVVYLKAVKKYYLCLGPELVADADIIQHIMTAMHLSCDRTEVRLAAHDRTRKPWQDPGAASQSGNYEPPPDGDVRQPDTPRLVSQSRATSADCLALVRGHLWRARDVVNSLPLAEVIPWSREALD
jgi:hypothetical protein